MSKKPSVNGDDTDIGPQDKWFVMVFMNGMRYMDGRYKDLVITPSIYRTFNIDDWDTWKGFTVERDSDADWGGGPRATSVTFTHDVWDHTANCPIHDVVDVVVTLGNGGNNGNNGDNNGERTTGITGITGITATG